MQPRALSWYELIRLDYEKPNIQTLFNLLMTKNSIFLKKREIIKYINVLIEKFEGEKQEHHPFPIIRLNPSKELNISAGDEKGENILFYLIRITELRVDDYLVHTSTSLGSGFDRENYWEYNIAKYLTKRMHDKRNHLYHTPLCEAVENNHEDFVSLLINAKCDLNVRKKPTAIRDHTSLVAAYEKKNEISLFVETENLNKDFKNFQVCVSNREYDDTDFTKPDKPPLLRAVEKKYFSIAARLIKAGADVNMREFGGGINKNIDFNVWRGYFCSLNTYQQMGATSIRKYYFGNSPLHWAIHHKHLDTIELLLEKGAVVDDQEKFIDFLNTCERNEEFARFIKFLSEQYKIIPQLSFLKDYFEIKPVVKKQEQEQGHKKQADHDIKTPVSSPVSIVCNLNQIEIDAIKKLPPLINKLDEKSIEILNGQAHLLELILKKEQELICADEDMKDICKNSRMADYYFILHRGLLAGWLACTTLQSGHLEDSKSTAAGKIAEGIKAIGKHIPGISIGTDILASIISLWNDRDKKIYINHITACFPLDMDKTNKMIVQLCQKMTLLHKNHIEQLAIQHPGALEQIRRGIISVKNAITGCDIDTVVKECAEGHFGMILTAMGKGELKLDLPLDDNAIKKLIEQCINLIKNKNPSINYSLSDRVPSNEEKKSEVVRTDNSDTSRNSGDTAAILKNMQVDLKNAQAGLADLNKKFDESGIIQAGANQATVQAVRSPTAVGSSSEQQDVQRECAELRQYCSVLLGEITILKTCMKEQAEEIAELKYELNSQKKNLRVIL